jgi:hypothetical protein
MFRAKAEELKRRLAGCLLELVHRVQRQLSIRVVIHQSHPNMPGTNRYCEIQRGNETIHLKSKDKAALRKGDSFAAAPAPIRADAFVRR